MPAPSRWAPLRPGRILERADGSAPGVLDPGLIWADGTGFADYDSQCTARVLIELEEGCRGQDLRDRAGGAASIPKAYDDASVACTAEVGAAFFKLLRERRIDGVARVDLSQPIVPGRAPARAQSTPGAAVEPHPDSTTAVLLGVIDFGCPFAHRSFMQDKAASRCSTRVLHLWDQDLSSALSDMDGAAAGPPAQFGYGRELSRAQLDALIEAYTDEGAVDEQACYAAANNVALRRRLSHGAHVMDLVAGPMPAQSRLFTAGDISGAFATQRGAAHTSDIVFVQLPPQCLQDTSGGWLGAQLLDGLRYIVGCRSDKTRRIVVNISYGSYVGPHDGSSIAEKAFDALIDEMKTVDLHIVFPSGNSRQKRCHSRTRLAPGDTTTLRWRILPDGATPSFLQLWQTRATDIDITVEPPSGLGLPSPPIACGQSAAWPEGGAPLCCVVHSQRRGEEEGSGVILVSVGSTADNGRRPAPAGDWVIHLRNRSKHAEVIVDGYIARNDTDIGTLKRGRQSYWVDEDYDPRRYLRPAEEDDEVQSDVKRDGTLNGIATGEKVDLVGGYRFRGDAPAKGASRGPTRTGKRRPDTDGIDWLGVSLESEALNGVLAAGNHSGSVARLLGTSFAAPQVSRLLANRRLG